ncbi:uncharacterized protein RT0683-like [Haliotis cracherodii]|uniref:uncharacterized protein RT0683-like n=1 Tax=Haliotis cracherodii TaxID=6455 RepID=UPI0039ECFD76
MGDIKEGKDGCLVSELDNGNSKTYTEAERRAKSLFYERISQKDKTEFRDLIQTFSKVVSSNITYFLYAGTLYGSYFHHGIVPWDDDFDIIVEDKDKPSLLKFLSILGPEYELYTGRRENWKFYRTQSQKAGKKKWNWPFLDIFFYSEKDTFIQTSRKLHKKFNKSDIFPLIRRPFMGMMLPAPRETRKVLGLHYNYDLHVCVSNSYDHRLEKPVPVKCRSRLPCSLLKDKFPFVTRKKSNNTSVEILEINYEYDSWL